MLVFEPIKASWEGGLLKSPVPVGRARIPGGWLVALMANKRRRRTIIVVVTAVFVLLAQLPNLVNIVQPWRPAQVARRVPRLVKEHPALRAYFIANALWEMTLAALKAFVVLYMTIGLHYKLTTASLMIGGVALVILIGAGATGKAGDKWGRIRVVKLALWGYGLGFLVLFYTSSVVLLWPYIRARQWVSDPWFRDGARMVVAAMPSLELVEADQAGEEFNRLNPGNSAPMVAWLASDEALHVTGQVFRAVGDSITHYIPWTLGTDITTPKGPRKWDPAEIGDLVNSQIFRCRPGGLQMGG